MIHFWICRLPFDHFRFIINIISVFNGIRIRNQKINLFKFLTKSNVWIWYFWKYSEIRVICIRHTLQFFEWLRWPIDWLKWDLFSFFLSFFLGSSLRVQVVDQVFCAHSIIKTRRECDYTFHTHLLLSAKVKFGVKRNLREKKVDNQQQITTNSINSIEFTKCTNDEEQTFD